MKTLALALVMVALASARPRLIVLTDIGGDPDDQQSMIRLMTYSNEFEIEALIASASGTPGELKKALVQPDLIREIVNAYGKVRPNLARHARGYPEAAALLARVASGDPDRSVKNLGPDSDTEGSRRIIEVVDRPDRRPVNVAIWGGAHDLAQALWRVRNDRPAAAVDQFVSRLRVHSIGHQDETGPWILENFPKLFFILSSADQGDVLGAQKGAIDRRLSVYRGMYLGGDEALTSKGWIEANVKLDHGPLGALYPMKTWTAPNPHSTLKEGDTPSWFYFLDMGLSDPEHPEWGSWGGRFRRLRDHYYIDAPEGRESVFRWRPAFQNDFAARMDWCAAEVRVNRAPLAVLNEDGTTKVLTLRSSPGKRVRLSAQGSTDPDGDAIAFRWWHYPQPGGSPAAVQLEDPAGHTAVFPVPAGTTETEFHVVLEVRDLGSPALVSYRRAIIRTAAGGQAKPPRGAPRPTR